MRRLSRAAALLLLAMSPTHAQRTWTIELDGAALADRVGAPLVDDGRGHQVRVVMGAT